MVKIRESGEKSGNIIMMMESMGPEILGFHFEVFLMIASGIFYILCAVLILKPFKEEKSELIGALFAFLVYQAISMVFMGLEMQTMNIAYSNIAALSIFIGSVYMLKFPLSSFSQGVRRVLFLLSLVITLGLFAWFMQTEEKQMELMKFVIWYDIIINGIIVGGFMIILALRTVEKWLRVKAIGGGAGVMSCCIAANLTMLSGAMILSAFFQFLAPVLILASLLFARSRQKSFA